MRAPLVGVIGSGNIGAGVARMAAGAGLGVVLANSRGPDSLTDLVSELGDLATADTVEGAVTRARLVVLAIPFGALSLLPGEAFDGAVVLDATNYYPDRDGHVAELDGGLTTSSEAIAARLPGTARVVKGLNNVDFLRLTRFPRPAGSPERTALPIAGDDDAAKSEVIAFLDALGFDALDLGGLGQGRRFQPGTPIYVAPYYRIAEPPPTDPMQAFVTATAVPVPLAQARELTAAVDS